MSISKRLAWVLFSTILFVSGSWATAAVSVTTTNDSIEPGSLRAAIIAANHRGGNNVIRLRSSLGNVYRLTIPGADEDSAQTGDLDITRGKVTIIGVGSNVTIDATGLG